MGNVLKVDGSLAEAWAEVDLGGDITEAWITWDELVDQPSFDIGIDAMFVTTLLNDDASVDVQAGIDDADWVTNTDSAAGAVGGTWLPMEFHRVPTDPSDFYVDSAIVATADNPNPGNDIRFVKFGHIGTSNDPNITYQRNLKIGTTRGGDDLFAWPDTETDLSAFIETEGAVSVVADPVPAVLVWTNIGTPQLVVSTSPGLTPGSFTERATYTAEGRTRRAPFPCHEDNTQAVTVRIQQEGQSARTEINAVELDVTTYLPTVTAGE